MFMLDGKRMLSPSPGEQVRGIHSPCLNIKLEVPCPVQQAREIKDIIDWKGRNKTLFTDDRIVYVENF